MVDAVGRIAIFIDKTALIIRVAVSTAIFGLKYANFEHFHKMLLMSEIQNPSKKKGQKSAEKVPKKPIFQAF